MKDEIIYGVIPRNVGPDGLRSVTAKLPDWEELGVTAIWISPINATPDGDFGYAVTDYFRLRADVGSEDDLRDLVRAAHAAGIRVLMDFVPNHTSAQHPYFVDVQERGADSPHFDFYDRDENGEQTHYFDWTHLPNLNFDNPEVERWITDAFCHWVREFDIDGFRVDVAWGIRQRKPGFWPELARSLRRLKPDALLLAEASARDDYYFSHGFDAAYDWTDELGHAAWEHVFDEPDQIVPRLHAALTNDGRGYSDDAVIFRFLNNNDTGARFVTRHGVDLTRVATALLLTLPGVPCIYVGDGRGGVRAVSRRRPDLLGRRRRPPPVLPSADRPAEVHPVLAGARLAAARARPRLAGLRVRAAPRRRRGPGAGPAELLPEPHRRVADPARGVRGARRETVPHGCPHGRRARHERRPRRPPRAPGAPASSADPPA